MIGGLNETTQAAPACEETLARERSQTHGIGSFMFVHTHTSTPMQSEQLQINEWFQVWVSVSLFVTFLFLSCTHTQSRTLSLTHSLTNIIFLFFYDNFVLVINR